ncbi:MAG: DUF4340 domain-containing protein [Desulfobacterales bacterium]|nr:DUF4340 domain-containing protein [Desulfobacterales bacterium]
MKAKKEYLILGVIIIVACLYLVFHKKDQTQYQLPTIAKIEIDTVTRLEIKTAKVTITLNKAGDQWLIAPQNYPADGAKIKGMLFELEDIVLTDLVSESKAYGRYQLDDNRKITIKARAGDKLIREFDIGKEAATYQHTFIRLPANPNVYHARGDFRRKFADSAADLRDREVLAFDPDALQKIAITIESRVLVLNRSQDSTETAPQPDQAPDKPAGAAKPAWVAPDGRIVDAGTLDSFLSSINNLKCEKYLEDRQKDDFKNPVFEITLEGEQTYSLSAFEKADEKATEVPAISSYNAYPFTLSSDRLDSLNKTVNRLIGKEAAPPKK